MTRMLDLEDILELVNECLNNSPAEEQDSIRQRHELVLHIVTQFGNQLDVEQIP